MKTETTAEMEMEMKLNSVGEEWEQVATSGKTSRQSTMRCGEQIKIGPTQ